MMNNINVKYVYISHTQKLKFRRNKTDRLELVRMTVISISIQKKV